MSTDSVKIYTQNESSTAGPNPAFVVHFYSLIPKLHGEASIQPFPLVIENAVGFQVPQIEINIDKFLGIVSGNSKTSNCQKIIAWKFNRKCCPDLY